MSRYQVLLLSVLVVWPVLIFVLLFLMSRLETYVNRIDASTPEEAGLEPVSGSSDDKEVRVVFGGKVVGEPEGATPELHTQPQPERPSEEQQPPPSPAPEDRTRRTSHTPR